MREQTTKSIFKSKILRKIKKDKPSLYKRCESYIEIFQLLYPNSNIFSKKYDITLARSIVIYFFYQEKIVNLEKDITMNNLAIIFNYSSHSGVTSAIKKVINFTTKNTTNRVGSKTKLFIMFYKCNKILTKNIQLSEKNRV